MSSRRFLPYVLVLSSCLLAGCARSGIVAARSVAPEQETVAVVLPEKTFDEDGGVVTPDPVGAFQFPDDRGGALLAKLLPPDLPHTPNERSTEPRRAPAANALESPTLPLSTPPMPMPRLPTATSYRPVQPRLLLTETLGGSATEPRLPQTLSLPAGELTRIPSVDVNKPIPLPFLGQALSDRAPLDDVTVEASNAAVLSSEMPRRTQPAPFVRNNLPDPFEFRRPIGLPGTPTEEPAPTTGSPKLP